VAEPDDLRLWLELVAGLLSVQPASYPFNVTGQPALSPPAGVTRSGLPVGLRLMGPVGRTIWVLSTARRIEAKLGPCRRHQIE